MSVIQKIRDKYAALVIALIALSLIAFILMDAFVGRGRGGGSTGSTLGKVNGVKIDKSEFDRKVEMMKQGQQNAQSEQLISSAWNQTVDDIVMKEEYDKLGLQLTNKELNDMLFGANPPQWMGQYFGDANGQVDMAKAKQAFAQLKKSKNADAENVNEALINPTINNQLRTKYMALINESTYVPKWMAEKMMAEQSSIAKFSYVSVPYSTISDSTIKVSDDDVRNYMNAHKSDFKQEEATRSISYVLFDASPNAKDSSDIQAQVMTSKNDFTSAPDVEAFLAKTSSELPYTKDYVLGSKMQVPFADTIKHLADGQVFGPYLDGTNYALAKMVGRRSMPDSAKCRHILIKTGEKGQVSLPDSIAKLRIDSIANAIKAGADFNTLVLQSSDDQGSKTTKGEYTFSSTQFSTISKEFAETIFYGKTGDKKIVKVENQGYSGYHYIEVLEQKGIETAYNVAYFAKAIVPSSETINTANGAAAQFAGSSRSKKAFEDNAKKLNKTPLVAVDIKKNDYTLGGVGESRPLIKWVHDNKVGDVSEVFDVSDKYVVAVITGKEEKGMMSLEKGRVAAEPFIRNERKAQQIINTKFKGALTTLEAAAQAAGMPILTADSVGFAQPFIPQVGNEPKIAGAAFNKTLQGKVSEPIAGNTGVFIIRGENISGTSNQAMNVEDQRKQMEMQQKQMGGYRSMEALKKAAKITDNRSDFY